MTESQPESFAQRIASRDTDAFTEFVRRYEHTMLRTAYRIVGQMADAQEIRQTVLTNLWRQSSRPPEPMDCLEAWVRRAVINASISLLRSKKRRRRREEHGARPESVTTDTTSDGEAAALHRALQQLTIDQRVLVSLRFDDQLTIREIANTLEKPHTTIQSQLQKAIAQLRSILAVPTMNRAVKDES